MSYKRKLGAIAGATLGYIAGNVPGAVAGGYYGYNASKNLPKQNTMSNGKRQRTSSSTWVSPTSSRTPPSSRKGYVFSGGKNTGRLSRTDFLKRIGVRKSSIRGRVRKSMKKRAVKTKRFTYQGTGTYVGKFKKGRKNKQTFNAKFLSQGCLLTLEQYGKVQDPDCAYLLHSSGHIVNTCQAISNALIRRILMKAGFKITNMQSELAVQAPLPTNSDTALDNSAGLRFVYVAKDQVTGAYRTLFYDTVDNQSYANICINFDSMMNSLIDYVRNDTTNGNPLFEPYKLSLYTRDQYTSGTSWNMAAEMHLEDCKIEIGYVSTIAIQNRTLAATSADADIDRVDTQPLKGYTYEFKHADPRLKDSSTAHTPAILNNSLWNDMNDKGLRLIRGNEFIGPGHTILGELNLHGGATEPLEPKYFANCDKSAKVILNPGDIKKMTFSYTLKGKVTNIIKKLKVKQWNSVEGSYSGMVGKSQMIALEELMRTDSSQHVTLAYERELKIGCIVRAGLRQAPIESIMIHQKIDNLIPA